MLNHPLMRALSALFIALVSATSMANTRIVSAGSAVTELIFALEQQQHLVAVDVTSELPDNIALPKIGYHRQLSAEGILALGTDRIIGSNEMGPQTTLTQLRSAGIDVDIVNSKPTAQGLVDRIEQIASITGATEKGQELIAQVSQQLDRLKANQSSNHSQAKKVLFLLLHEGRPANVAGAETTPNAIIELAGGINPAAEKLTSYKPLSAEAMIEMQPDIILVSGRSYAKLGGADAILSKMPMLAATPAGKNKQVIQIDGHALVGGLGLKSLAEAERLSALIH
ncbi:hemin ABC transporter substrate-binding protein [Vibrio sp. JPW-9-11-11]|nr:hemin ABC transporter substrate-binding protein [Vibrio sp. JPW-9-11-11]NVD08877.1 hemin ABC transporter substrate-binding protein [Vibrio sp. JPW-9-11-11]